jgi:hypothetical protein
MEAGSDESVHPANLSETERHELRMLVGELNLGELLRNGAMRASRGW